MNYTKGEWKAYGSTVHLVDSTTSTNIICCDQLGFMAEGEAHANAYLISAAPEMYEALKGLCHAYNVDEYSIIPSQDPEYWRRVFRALAKAEGREEV